MSGTAALSSRNAISSSKSIFAGGICRSVYCNLYSLDLTIKKFQLKIIHVLPFSMEGLRFILYFSVSSSRSRGVMLTLGKVISTTPDLKLLRAVASKSSFRLRDCPVLRMIPREFMAV